MLVSAVPDIDFSFRKKPEDSGTTYTRINECSTLWVPKADAALLKREALSLKEYGNRLLWGLVFKDEDIVLAYRTKKRSIGFTKLFGKKNTRAFYGRSICTWRIIQLIPNRNYLLLITLPISFATKFLSCGSSIFILRIYRSSKSGPRRKNRKRASSRVVGQRNAVQRETEARMGEGVWWSHETV